jgi:hypothetical protein
MGHIGRMLTDPSPGDASPAATDLPKRYSPVKVNHAPVWWVLVAQLFIVIALIIVLVI